MQTAVHTLCALALTCAAGTLPAHAAVVQGSLDAVYDSETFTIGDLDTTLSVYWSARHPQSSGWFYPGPDALTYYVATGMTNPTTVSNAASFSYQSGVVTAAEGDTVFARSAGGYYAAIVLTNFEMLVPEVPAPGGTFNYLSTLTGTWYFDSSQTGDFTAAVPEPSTWLTMLAGLALVGAGLRRKTA
ncbi:MAG: PEP-CTERM sorting domain-containing protein [Gemmatimonadaceae bacterium]|nr:PEP-CTERM sorting domain-containing protein [Gemmatimonadaceae bacterium]